MQMPSKVENLPKETQIKIARNAYSILRQFERNTHYLEIEISVFWIIFIPDIFVVAIHRIYLNLRSVFFEF